MPGQGLGCGAARPPAQPERKEPEPKEPEPEKAKPKEAEPMSTLARSPRAPWGAALLLLTLAALGQPPAAAAADLRGVGKAVVKLYVTVQGWDMKQPWSKRRLRRGTCSAFLIEQGILTNAHCVTDATYIRMEVPGLADKVDVERVAVDHQVDLALLKPVDPAFRFPARPIAFGDLPRVREKVVTVGYPLGGSQVSYTEGVVSRIDMMTYAHSNIGNLMVQTDAAINPGNSGGPVLSDRTGRCLGVATQKALAAEGTGYFIPVPVIRQFLDDLADGRVDGVPGIGVYVQSMENPALRASFRMKADQSGIRITRVGPRSPAHGLLRRDDVILAIDGHRIYNDGRVDFRDEQKIGWSYYLRTHQVGEPVRLRILREGRERELTVRLAAFPLNLVPRMPLYEQRPRYHVLGGVLFRVVEPRYLQTWGRNWPSRLPLGLRKYLGQPAGYRGLDELVVISNVFPAAVNKGYQGLVENSRVLSVDGREIHNLRELVEALEAPSTEPFIRIDLENGTRLVLDREEVRREEEAIRRRYNIPLGSPALGPPAGAGQGEG
ncbi:MAG: serine protease [Gammaproteobacteria bacterium]|nr:MAG: serine protease [Gammaproteobacteria bacterium]